MTMTATEIKLALKPMAQFAPALMSAIEIIESAEAAEKSMKPLAKQKADLEKQIAELEARFGSTGAQVSKEKTDFNAFMAEQEAKRQATRADTQKVADALAAMQLKLLNLNAEYDAKRKEKEAEITALESTQDKIKAGIERLKKQFAA